MGRSTRWYGPTVYGGALAVVCLSWLWMVICGGVFAATHGSVAGGVAITSVMIAGWSLLVRSEVIGVWVGDEGVVALTLVGPWRIAWKRIREARFWTDPKLADSLPLPPALMRNLMAPDRPIDGTTFLLRCVWPARRYLMMSETKIRNCREAIAQICEGAHLHVHPHHVMPSMMWLRTRLSVWVLWVVVMTAATPFLTFPTWVLLLVPHQGSPGLWQRQVVWPQVAPMVLMMAGVPVMGVGIVIAISAYCRQAMKYLARQE